jgi:hypothetical protein
MKESREKPERKAIIYIFRGIFLFFSQDWYEQNIRHLKPKKLLSLFELAVLANVVHKEFPKYTLLKEQCYFLPGSFILPSNHFGVSSSSPAKLDKNKDLVHHIIKSLVSIE